MTVFTDKVISERHFAWNNCCSSGYELSFQRESPSNGRSNIVINFSMLGLVYMGNREQNRKGDDSKISHRVCAPDPDWQEEGQIFIHAF